MVLRDGSTLPVRPVKVDDEAELARFYNGLSPESRMLRFFHEHPTVDEMAKRMVRVDYEATHGLVAVAGGNGGRIVGHVTYVQTGSGRAEVGIATSEDQHGKGLGILLFGQMAQAAADAGIGVFEANVKENNHVMLEMLRESGYPVAMRSVPGEVHAELATTLSVEARENFDNRDKLGAIAAVNRFLAPKSVAIVAGSLERGQIGGEVWHNLRAAGFTGPAYPVSKGAPPAGGVMVFPSVGDIPDPVEVAVIVLSAAETLTVAAECAAKGIKGLIVISSGFAETGPEGAERQKQLVELCRTSGMRVIGPNCVGVLNTSHEYKLNASVLPFPPPAGRVGFLSQSGSLGLAVMEHARALGSGISSFVSAGNTADISAIDLMSFWEADPATNLVMLYLESLENPRQFGRVARRVGLTVPILAVKAGRSAAGARATGSHTGALVAPSSIRLVTSNVSGDALFEQAGVIRVDTLGELFDAAQLLSDQPLPSGNKVAIITNAGGPGVLCADACAARGLAVPDLPDDARAVLAAALPAAGTLSNPIDILPTASPDEYKKAIDAVAAWPAADAMIVIFTPQVGADARNVAAALREAAAALKRPIPMLAVLMSTHDGPSLLSKGADRIPFYAFPEDAARALGHAVRYVAWRQVPREAVPELDGINQVRAAALIAATLGQGSGWVSPTVVSALLACYGLAPAESLLVTAPHDAGEAAKKLGGKVAVKGMVKGLTRKSDAGAVRLEVEGAHDVEEAAKDIAKTLATIGRKVDAFMVQRMAPPGVETIVGMVQDRYFGPVMAVGASGKMAELLRDVQIRITPLTRSDAATMVRSLATYPLLDGYRGATPVSVPALEDLLLRISALVEEHHEVAEIELSPVIVNPNGAVIVDARVRLEPSEPRRAFH